MQRFLLVLAIMFSCGNSSNFCKDYISCNSSENLNSCPKGTFYRERVKVHGCCPGCVELKGENQPCSIPDECQPGFTCSPLKKCILDPQQVCEYYKKTHFIWTKNQYWNPACRSDGTYAPKQCKGEKMSGKCFCVDRMGNRLFGEKNWPKAENMTCACSRRADEMKAKASATSLHCDGSGSFEPLQCDGKTCWCAGPENGFPYTPMLPVEAMVSLPCYHKSEAGNQYYKQCDSADHSRQVVKTLLRNHGTKDAAFTEYDCNFDGSYRRVQNFKEKKRCVFIDNSPLTEASSSKEKVDCNCAFDRHVAQLLHFEFTSNCLPNGNYCNRQTWNGKVFCVDEDGFFYSDNSSDCLSY